MESIYRSKRSVTVLSLLFILAFELRLYNISRPITDPYSFRQSQTAWLIRYLSERGLDLFSGFLPVLGAPWQLPFEFPLYQNIAALLVAAVGSVEVAGRLVSIGSCFVAAGIFHGLVRHYLGGACALLSTGVFLFAPYSIFWSTAVIIDFFALALSLGFLWGIHHFAQTRRAYYLLIATACAAAAGAVKLPSLLFYIMPGAWMLYDRWRIVWDELNQNQKFRLTLLVLLCAVVSMLPFVVWTQYADAVKNAHHFTVFATSYRLHNWYFGSAAQILDLWGIARVISRMLENFGLRGFSVLLLLGVARGISRRDTRGFVCSFLLQLLLTIVVFRNLHLAHHYYQISIFPAVSMFIGLGFLCVGDFFRRQKALGVGLVLVAMTLSRIERIENYLATIYSPAKVPDGYKRMRELGLIIKAETQPNDRIGIVGQETWDPSILYAADRYGFMVRSEAEVEWKSYVTSECYDYILFIAGASQQIPKMIETASVEPVRLGDRFVLARLRYNSDRSPCDKAQAEAQ